MGTVFSFDIRPTGLDEATTRDAFADAIEVAVRRLHWVDSTFSTFQPGSQLSRLARGELALDACAPEMRTVLARCEKLRHETAGYFSADADGRLDPSGYVKGWAIEQASDILAAAGSTNHCINGGGDVQCVGHAAPDQPWRIGIAHPHRPGQLAGVVAGADLAVATSGTAERGQHVIDPHTRGRPATLGSVTVVGPRLADADAYATAAFAMGADARDWLEQLPGYWGFVVTADGSTWSTSGWANPG
ncbi:MAG: FAD:protein FMN transferase [Jatrophihabitantaceae bacterium]